MVRCFSYDYYDLCTIRWRPRNKTGSEDGCGSSWPLCNGALLPENLPIQTIIELSHRAVSAISLIVVLWLVITAWKNIGYIKEIKPLSIISVGFISSST